MLLGKGPVCQATPLASQAEQGMKSLTLEPDADLSQPLENSSGSNLSDSDNQPATNFVTQNNSGEE
jgi:hypothetical protein